jgi:(S)-ureidoglycine aminohydrolase
MNMAKQGYNTPPGGLPPQSQLLTGRAVFTGSYAVIPKTCMSDIVTSFLPHWQKTRLWILARPLSGFAETFSQYLMEVQPDGGSDRPESDAAAEAILFVMDGRITVTINGKQHIMESGGYCYLPPACQWTLHNRSDAIARFHWFRKRYRHIDDIEIPPPLITNEAEIKPVPMPDTEGRWSTTRFVDPEDLRHDMHVNIVNLAPGAVIPFAETHVMEHGIYILQGKAVYHLNQDWVEVEAGDFLWLRAFCPQACYAGGPETFRYLLYKDVNRHARL